MESDCVDHTNSSVRNEGTSSNQDNIMQMLNLISSKMMDTIQDLQQQLVQNDLKFTEEIRRLSQENETFRRTIIADLQTSQPSATTNQVVTSTSSIQNVSTPPVATPISSGLLSVSQTGGSNQDFQQQMLSMLNDTFSKLTTVITDVKNTDSKSTWPKFSGDTKKFKHWYLAIVAQLSLAPWSAFYDFTNNTLVKTTTDTVLNEKLYAKLLLSLEGQVFQDMVARKHLRGNGLLLLTELSQTYRPCPVPEVIAAKTVEFWSTLKRSPKESIDAYYNRFQALLDDLEEAGEPILLRSAIRQLIFKLGSDFAPIQNNHRIGLLPEEWKTTDWPSLLVLCRNCATSVTPHGHKHDTHSDRDGSSFDHSTHHK
jgi:hypothetical protein